MRTTVCPQPVAPAQKSTWFYLNDKSESLSFDLDYPHFVHRAGRMRTGIISDGSTEDMTRIKEQFIATSGTVVEMIELFIAGGVVKFPDPTVAVVVYRRILKHFDAHQHAIRTDLGYEIPDGEFFRNAAEFAMSIRPIAMCIEPDIDNEIKKSGVRRTGGAIPRFSDSLKEKQEAREKAADDVVPAPLRKLDAIEKFLDLNRGGR